MLHYDEGKDLKELERYVLSRDSFTYMMVYHKAMNLEQI